MQTASELTGKTTYQRTCKREEAPKVTDCLTSLHYLFKQVKVEIPVTYIGDMPRELLKKAACHPIRVKSSQIKCGDIIFCRSKTRPKLVSHVAVALDVDKIFHCNFDLGTAVVQSQEDFFSRYMQELNFRQMARYIDPRNKPLREQYKGIFIDDNKKL